MSKYIIIRSLKQHDHQQGKRSILSSIFILILKYFAHPFLLVFYIVNQSDADASADRETGGWMISQIQLEVGGDTFWAVRAKIVWAEISFFGRQCQNQVSGANKVRGQASDKL